MPRYGRWDAALVSAFALALGTPSIGRVIIDPDGLGRWSSTFTALSTKSSRGGDLVAAPRRRGA